MFPLILSTWFPIVKSGSRVGIFGVRASTLFGVRSRSYRFTFGLRVARESEAGRLMMMRLAAVGVSGTRFGVGLSTSVLTAWLRSKAAAAWPSSISVIGFL